MNFITHLPLSHGYSTIMVVVDRLSKFGHFIALKENFTSKIVAYAFVNNIVKLYGVPKPIVSDRDRVFLSSFWQQLFKAQGTTLSMSSSYHLQTDGQSEALNKTLEMYLRCFVFDHPKTWVPMLPWAQFWYNSSWHHSVGMPPFQALYGREPP
nr:Retrotransposable element Tf2 [Cajanus cajan]